MIYATNTTKNLGYVRSKNLVF